MTHGHDAAWRELEIAVSSIELRVDEYIVPDAGKPIEYAGPIVMVIAHGERVVTMAARGARVAPVAPVVAAQLVAAARAALACGGVAAGPDTATGRTITFFRLAFTDAHGATHTSVAQINHYADRLLPEPWSDLVRRLHDAAAPIGASHDDWARVLRWVRPLALGDAWYRGEVVPLPFRTTRFRADGPTFVRTGQPPKPSWLYLIDPIDERRQLVVIAGPGLGFAGGTDSTVRIDERGRHVQPLGPTLPCETAAITVGRGEITIDILATDRWVFVQRGGPDDGPMLCGCHDCTGRAVAGGLCAACADAGAHRHCQKCSAIVSAAAALCDRC
jgi:hypothetical protein